MSIYSKSLSDGWRQAFDEYERISGFEPMHQDDIDSGDMTPRQAWNLNIQFLENVLSDVTHISIPDCDDQESEG